MFPARLFFAFTLLACSSLSPKPAGRAAAEHKPGTYQGKLPIDRIKLPAGFSVDVYAEDLRNARSLCYAPSGTLFVGTRDAGNVYALRDTNGDFRADVRYLLAKGLNMPNGVAYRNGSLFVAEISRILRFDRIEERLNNPPPPVVVFDGYPTEEHHGWKYIAFGPDGKLYVPVGAPCNICEPENPVYSSITRLDVDKPGPPEIVQKGIRNSVGFCWHPQSGEMWFTDNGRDWLGDDSPSCELNRATRDGLHFGYPYCHQGDTPDPKYGGKRACTEFIPPAEKLGPHVAPLGLTFYTGEQFPEYYQNQMFIAEHGSWNRSQKIGYQVSLVRIDAAGNSLGKTAFATGWLQSDGEVWGRPVDLEVLPDGSVLVSDDHAHAIYRIYYQP